MVQKYIEEQVEGIEKEMKEMKEAIKSMGRYLKRLSLDMWELWPLLTFSAIFPIHFKLDFNLMEAEASSQQNFDRCLQTVEASVEEIRKGLLSMMGLA